MVKTPNAQGIVARTVRLLAAPVALAGLAVTACTSAAAPPAHIRLLVSQRVSLYDVPLGIRVGGLHPGEKVTLRLQPVGPAWSASAAQAAFDAAGPVLDLDKAAPVSGSYHGTDGMGLFEALTPSRSASPFAIGVPQTFTLTASASGGGSAAATLTRQLIAPGVTCSTLTVAAQGLSGRYCAPPRPPGTRLAARLAVLVFGGSEGGLSTAATAELLASRGFPALALAYFGAPGLPVALDRIPLEYFAHAAGWLGRQQGVDSGRVTAWGNSRGSEAALLLGAYFPGAVHAVIAGSPSSVSNGAVSLTHPVPPTDPAWTLRGKPIPRAAPLGDPSSRGNPAAVIPVQRIQGPVLLLVGGDDQLWPSPKYAQAIVSRLRASHDRYAYLDDVFPAAGHAIDRGFPYDVFPTSVATAAFGTIALGGTAFADSAAETHAWQDVLAFVRAG